MDEFREQIKAKIINKRLHKNIKKYPWSWPENYYDFLTPDSFDWRQYADQLHPALEIFESPEKKKAYLAFAILFLIMGSIFFFWLYKSDFRFACFLGGTLMAVSVLWIYKFLRKPPLILSMTDHEIRINKTTFIYTDLAFVYFRYFIGGRGSGNMIVFALTNGKNINIDMQRLGYTPQMLGRTVYTRIKLAKKVLQKKSKV